MLTTPKGRIVDRLLVSHLGDGGLLLVAGAGRAKAVLEHIGRYTFSEQTGLVDRSDTTCQLALVGPRAAEVLDRL